MRLEPEKVRILLEELKRGGYPSRVRLAVLTGMTERTVGRYIRELREEHGWPIGNRRGREGGYFLEHTDFDPIPSFPLLGVSEEVIQSLFVGLQVLKAHEETPFFEPVQVLLGLMRQQFGEMVSLDPKELDEHFVFLPRGKFLYNRRVFRTVIRGMLECRMVDIDYRSRDAQVDGTAEPKRHRICPLRLECREDRWYIRCWVPAKTREASYYLSRISRALLQKRQFNREAFSNIWKKPIRRFEQFDPDGDYAIRIRFGKEVAFRIREEVVHPSQEIEDLSDGGLILHLRLGSLIQITSWIQTYGPFAEVLDPPELREKMQRITREMAALYA